MARLSIYSWTPEDEEKLRQLAAKGASLLRACAAMGRTSGVIRKKAKQLGIQFDGVRKVRAANRILAENAERLKTKT
jgi:hypothetical protein